MIDPAGETIIDLLRKLDQRIYSLEHKKYDSDGKTVTNGDSHDHVGGDGATIPIAGGGTGQITQQAAIDALADVTSATDEHVLTKDTASGNAIFKVSPSVAHIADLTNPHAVTAAQAAATIDYLTNGTALSPFAVTANGGYFSKIFCAGSKSMTTISCYVSGAIAGSTIELGVYDNAGSKLASATVSGATTGFKTVTITAQNLTPGMYWLAFACDQAVTVYYTFQYHVPATYYGAAAAQYPLPATVPALGQALMPALAIY